MVNNDEHCKQHQSHQPIGEELVTLWQDTVLPAVAFESRNSPSPSEAQWHHNGDEVAVKRPHLRDVQRKSMGT
jgi:hypothetical protein